MTQWHPDGDPRWPAGPGSDPGAAGGTREAGYLPGPGFAGPAAGDDLTGWAVPSGDGFWPAETGAETADWPAAPGARRRRPPPRRRRRLLLPAVAAVLIAVAAVAVLTARPHARPAAAAAGGPSASRPPASLPPGRAQAGPAISRAAAQLLLSRYVAANNAANRVRSDAQLARIEGGSSFRLDAGGYQFQAASDPANTGYQTYTYTPAAWYIPRLASWPRWFAVYGTWAGTRSAAYRGYLLFAQAGPAARWLQVLEPNTATGMTGPAATPAAGPDGYATALPASSAAGLAAPGTLPSATAAELDGTAGTAALTGLQTQADQRDEAFWRARVPRGGSVTDRHSPAPDGVYALAARGGGAIVFYSVSASLVITPPPGAAVQLQIPGYYSGSVPRTTAAAVPYAEQFAVWIGPRGGKVIAGTSGVAASR